MARYAAAGFTHFQSLDGQDGSWRPYSPAGNARALEYCARAGIRCFVADDRIYRGDRPLPADRAPRRVDVAAALAEYARHPACAGFLIYDEPSPHAFGALAEVCAWMAEDAPEAIPLIPLFPMHADPRFPDAFEGLSYEQYLEGYLTQTGAGALAYDYYPFFDPSHRMPEYLTNFALAREVARRRGVPLWYYAGIVRPAGADPPTPARIRFQVNLALAHGARAIFHYTYRTPPGDTMGPIRMDGTVDEERWNAMRAINLETAALLDATAGWSVEAVIHSSAGDVIVEEGASLALFARDRERLAFLVNREVASEGVRKVRVQIAGWTGSAALDPGGARLLRVD